MNEAIQIFFGITFLIMIFLLSRMVMGLKIKNAVKSITNDLKEKNAFNHSSAITLPYASQSFFRFGVRDFKPKTLNYLISNNVVGKTEDNRFFLMPGWEKNISQK